MSTQKTNNGPETALFVCFGGMFNVGTLTGQAGVEVVKLVGPGKACLVCLAGLITRVPSVVEKTNNARRIVTVDGCALNCARKIVGQAGYTLVVAADWAAVCASVDAGRVSNGHFRVNKMLERFEINLISSHNFIRR
jgi:uncharacterized metal-binding protein